MRNPLNAMMIRPCQFGAHDPISNTFGNVRNGGARAHQGWDLQAGVGTPVFAIADGEATTSQSQSYGKCVTLKFQHRDQTYYAFYAHLDMQMCGNASVRQGTVVGLTGMSGNAQGIPTAEAHLHFEIRTTANPPMGLAGRVDPGVILGFGVYASQR